MLSKLARRITTYLDGQGVLSGDEDEPEIVAFGLECWIADLIQFILLLIGGLLLGILLHVVVFGLFFAIIKRHIGGWHANTHLSCFIMTTGLFCAAPLLARMLPWWSALPILICAIVIILALAPIPHENNPKTSIELVQSRKLALLALKIEGLVILVLTLCSLWEMAVCACLGLFCAASSLPISIWERKGAKKWRK